MAARLCVVVACLPGARGALVVLPGARRAAAPVLCEQTLPLRSQEDAPAFATDDWIVRPAARSDLWRAATLMQDAFTAPGRPGIDRWLTTCRLALDIEQRMTPWDWARHRQFVVEAASAGEGEGLLGFAELWAEDDACLEDRNATVPQPALFNVCVSPAAEGRGIGRALLQRAEEECLAWEERYLFLKVKESNARAAALYRRAGFEQFAVRMPTDVPAWQERWKGGTQPLTLMSKRVREPPQPRTLGLPVSRPGARPPQSATARAIERRGVRQIASQDPLSLDLGQVLAYRDPDALVWFALLISRNARALSPVYAVVPAVAGLLTSSAILSMRSP